MRLSKTPLFLILLFLPVLSYSGGFQINQLGHKATGLGGAFIAYPFGDASMAFYNPGALGTLQGHHFTGGLTILSPHVSARTSIYDNIDQTSSPSYPFQVYYGGSLTEKLSIGFSMNNQFGSSSSYKEDWQGRYIVQNIGLRTFMFQPTVSYQLHEKVGIGAGLVYSTGNFHYEKALPFNSNKAPYGKAILDGSGDAFSFNVGVHSVPIEQKIKGGTFSVGLAATYRHSLNMELDEGTAEFKDIPASLRESFPKETAFTSSIELPAVANGGISLNYRDSGKYSIRVLYDLNYTMWSSYDSLKFDFKNEETPDSETPKQWKDVKTHRIGLELGYKDRFFLRGGLYIDNTPIPDGFVSPELPDNDHTGFTVGIGVELHDAVSIDLSYLRSEFERMDASLKAEGFTADYRRIVNVYGAGINIRIDELING